MRMKSALYSIGLVAAAAAVSTNVAQAQASASVTASANVAAALTAASVHDLTFGTVIANYPRSIATTDATNAGIVKFTGGVNAEVAVTFPSLPTTLIYGANTLPVSFTGGYSATQTGTQTAISNMASGVTTRLDGTTGLLYIFVGGTASPGASQTAGAYSNSVTVQAAYTGN